MKLKCDLIIQNLNDPSSHGVLNQEKMHKSSHIGLYRPRSDDIDETSSEYTQNDIILSVETKTLNVKYKIKRLETYTKFIHEGKATLKLIDENIYLLISNCTAMTLTNFIAFLNAKLTKKTMMTTSTLRQNTQLNNKENKENQIRKLHAKSVSEVTSSSKSMAAPSSFSLLNKSNKEPKYVNKLLNNAQCTLGKNSLQGISPLCEKELNDIVAYRQSKQVKQEQCTNSSPITINRTRPSQMSLMGRSQSQSVLLPSSSSSSSSFNNTTKTLTRQSSSTNNLLVQLTECQRKVLAVVKKKSGGLFFTGSGGTGKSFLINVIRKCLPSESCFVTASTGVAASLIDGVTLHSFSGISTELMEKLYELENEEESVNDEGETSKRDRILKEILNKVVNSKEKLTNWKKCLHLVIDEISMVDAVLFETLDFIARSIKNSDLPFGGIQLILSGDFFQLPPVSKYRQQKKKFCFQSHVWREAVTSVIELKQIKRQSDKVFIDMLEEIRYGNCSQKTTDLLEKCKNKSATNSSASCTILPTRLFTHNDDVDLINTKELKNLKDQTYTFKSIDSGDTLNPTKSLNQLCAASETLTLKKNAQVMLLKNMDVSGNLVNGSRGCVVGFTDTSLPIVRFLNGTEMTIKYDAWSFKVNTNGSMITRKQLPLQLAWAISIHKSQGMTLDCVEISLSRVFEYGQAYVALSRAKSLNSIKIIDFDAGAIRANQTVVKFYERFRKLNE